MDQKIALITGATSGIGKATAVTLAKMGYAIIATGRRAERLSALKDELPKNTPYLPLQFDVKKRKEVEKVFNDLPEAWLKIEVLVNNAGNAHGLSPIQDGDVDDWDAMMDINVKGLLYVSKAVIPGMVARKSGQILNVGSIAAKEVYPNGNVYCASKHAVDAITKGMRMDLNPYGIKVMAIHPGLVETEFSLVRFKGDSERAKSVYQGFAPLLAEDIAEVIAFAISRPSHVVMADMVVLATAQGSSTMVHKDLQK